MNLLLIRQIWKHHSSKSGYDRVFQTFDGKDANFIFMKQHVPGYGYLLRILQFLFPRQKEYISVTLLLTEIEIFIKSIFLKPDVIHFTYLQSEFILFRYKLFRPKAKLIATIHLPNSYWTTKKQSWGNFKYLDQIIVLDHVSLSFFKKHELTKNKTILIPHPVDMEYYQPRPDLKFNDNKIHCLYIGRFLRDMDLFFDIVEYCHENNKNIIFYFSYPHTKEWIKDASRLEKIIKLDNVNYKSYLSEEELKKLYQSCDALVQPLLDSTVNNVIIEAVACGLLVVVNELPALNTYIDEGVAVFCKKNIKGFVEAIINAKNKKISTSNKLSSLQDVKNKLNEAYAAQKALSKTKII